MQKLGKFNVKKNVIPIRLKKNMSFKINHKLVFFDNFQFLSSLLDSLVKNQGKDDFNYFSLEFDTNVLNLVKQKGFYPYQ